ncbi:MAG: DUF4277 domain-containing protein [Euryarchaeota archaeon]|nr:DUF4277 domain-containing protein [Euryarchaeota archaeon]
MTIYENRNLDHLGIVSGVCKEINLAEVINDIIGVNPRQKVACRQAVESIILNCLGFVDKPLYLIPEFMATKTIEILIGEGLKKEYFSDDCLVRSLDKLYLAGPEGVFMRIAVTAYEFARNDHLFRIVPNGD